MKWRYVFNTNVSSSYLGLPMKKIIERVKPTGYKYFTFNDMVFDLNGMFTGCYTSQLT